MLERQPQILVAALISKPDQSQLLLTRHEGSPFWHFPDGAVKLDESLIEALHRSLGEDLGVAPIKIVDNGYACLPVEGISLTRLPNEPFNLTSDTITLHFPVCLPAGAPLTPRPGLEIHWWPLNPCFCVAHKFALRPSTAEIFRRLNEEI